MANSLYSVDQLQNSRAQSRLRMPPLQRVLALFSFVFLTAWAGIDLGAWTQGLMPAWLPNGAALACLLTADLDLWLVYLAVAFMGIVAGDNLAGVLSGPSCILAGVNIAEILCAAIPLRLVLGNKFELGSLKNLSIFVGLALGLAPALSAILASSSMWLIGQSSARFYLTYWFLAHALGMSIVTPLAIAFLQRRPALAADPARLLESFAWLLLSLTVSGLVFYQTRYPFLFFIPPALLAATFTQNFTRALFSVPFLGAIALFSTAMGHGPFSLAVSASLTEKISLTQLFIICNFLMLAYVAAIADERRRAQGNLEAEHRRLITSEQVLSDSELHFRMLTEYSVDMVFRTDEDGIVSYASPSLEEVLGWKPAEIVGRQAVDFVHPDDAPVRQALIEQLHRDGGMVTSRTRSLHKNGSYIWIERRTRLVRSADRTFMVTNARDISENKKAEELLAEANAKLQQMAMSDALTGIANRRLFDQTLDQEWGRMRRAHQPLSLLLLDVDHFKQYNDAYGHQQGDLCLQKVAQTVGRFARRPGDLAARYGGEELALLLPGCDKGDAQSLAESLRQEIAGMCLPHIGNPECGSILTASIGVSTLRPADLRAEEKSATLIQIADSGLYEAKRLGRNRTHAIQDIRLPSVSSIADNEEEKRHAAVGQLLAQAHQYTDDLNHIAYLAAKMLNMPIALVSLIGKDKQTVLGRYGLDIDECPRDISFCAHTLNGKMPLIVNDATVDSRFKDYPAVTGDMNVRFYAGAPLLPQENGMHLGTLCVVDQKPHPSFDEDQRKMLIALAALAMRCVEGKTHEAAMPRFTIVQ